MYPIFLATHNIIRWVALILTIVAVVRAYLGWFGKREWTQSDRKIGSFTAMTYDIQLLLGLILYFVYSPVVKTALQDFGAAMQVADVRFFALEHTLYMLLAVVFAHLGSALPRKAEQSVGKYKRAAIAFTLALLLVLLGMPWMRPFLPGLG